MADKVKKGFGFYLFMLILLLLAAFLVIVMIMLFSPGTTILGYRYFSYNDTGSSEKVFTQTNSESANNIPLDFNNIDEFVINSGYANVKVTKSAKDDSQDAIIVSNSAKGFAKGKKEGSEDLTEFKILITLARDNGKNILSVNVTEPQGFLMFSKSITINISAKKSDSDDFTGSNFTITTKSGKVDIDPDCSNLTPANLNISTDSGAIVFNGNFSEKDKDGKEVAVPLRQYSSLFLSTKNGKVTAKNNFQVGSAAKFSIDDKGSIELKNVIGDVELAVGSGKFSAESIYGKVKTLNLKNGSIDIENIFADTVSSLGGSFVTNNAGELGKGSIKLGYVGVVSIPDGNQASIEIGTLKGKSFINTTSGSVKVTKALLAACDIVTTTGNIDVMVDDETYNAQSALDHEHKLTSEKGKITLRFASLVKSISNIQTKGDVEIYTQANSKFTLDLNNYDGEAYTKLNDKISINFINNPDLYQYPFKVNEEYPGLENAIFSSQKVVVKAGGKIYVRHAVKTDKA